MDQKLYLVLASQRTGSTLLCDLLTQTGLAGTPGEHFYHGVNDEIAHKQFPLKDYPAYIKQVVSDTQTTNGVFGVKLMAGVAGGWAGPMQRLRRLPRYVEMPLAAVIDEFFPHCCYIYLTRRNKIAQAVSWWKMAQGALGHITDDTQAVETPLAYNFDAIDHLVNEVMMQEAAHQAFLDELSAVPHTVVHEDFIQNMEGTIQSILDFLDLSADCPPLTQKFKRTANAQSEDWIQRYRGEKQANWQNIRW